MTWPSRSVGRRLGALLAVGIAVGSQGGMGFAGDPAGSFPPDGVGRAFAAEGQAVPPSALALVADARALGERLLAAEGIAPVLQEAAAAAGVEVALLPPEPGTLEEELAGARAAFGIAPSRGADIAALPLDLQAALARLVRAAREAAMLQQQALAGLDPSLAARLFGEPASVALQEPEALREALAGVRLDLVAQAGYRVAEAIDRALPVLVAHRDFAWEPAQDAATTEPACALFNAPLLRLCDGRSGDAHPDEYYIDIDLGGDSSWTNTGCGVQEPDEPMVKICIDAGGDDRYSNGVWGRADPVVTTYGAARGGVAALVDAAGADSYSASASTGWNQAGATSLLAFGASVAGVGIFVDDLSTDYVVGTSSSRGGNAEIVASGASVGGIGISLASFRESFAANAALQLTSAKAVSGDAIVLAQGAAVGRGAGVRVDRSGDDSRSVSAYVETSLNSRPPEVGLGKATVVAQGAGADQGAGILADGEGDDTSLVQARGQGASAVVQGAGSAGQGLLFDGAGRDYAAAYVESFAAESQYLWSGLTCTAKAESGPVILLGQGAARGQGSGQLVDLSGSDTRFLHSSSSAYAACGTPTAGSTASAEATSGPADTIGQGAASAQGHALRFDANGNDGEFLYAYSYAAASAYAGNWLSPGKSATATAVSGDATNLGQGAALDADAVALDEGGRDSYQSVASSYPSASASPPTSITRVQGKEANLDKAHGDSTARLLFADLGCENDAYGRAPNNPPRTPATGGSNGCVALGNPPLLAPARFGAGGFDA